MTKYMTWKAPKRYHSKLIPEFRTAARYLLFNKDLLNHIVRLAPGCKRVIVDPGYLESLHRPNVTLSYDAIKDIVPEGVRLETGEIVQLDVLILGTGFSLVRHWSYHMRMAPQTISGDDI
jgi:cation diffusion facilitator CzcD-associated flavoprotein CzcO